MDPLYKLIKIKAPTVYPLPAYQIILDGGKEAGTVYKMGSRSWKVESALFDYNVISNGLAESVKSLLEEMEERGF